MKLARIHADDAHWLGNAAVRIPFLENHFEYFPGYMVCIIPGASTVEGRELDFTDSAALLRRDIERFKTIRDRMSASNFAEVLEEMEDDLRALEQCIESAATSEE